MKLMTEMSGEGDDVLLFYNGDIGVSTDDQAEHDAAAAHALMQALNEAGGLSIFTGRGSCLDWIGRRADGLMTEWGFGREAGK